MTLVNKGFTLIELLVVIAIIGILTTLVIIAVATLRRDAVNTRIQSDVRQLRVLAEAAYDSSAASYVDWSQAATVQSEVTTLLADIDDAHNSSDVAVIRETQQKDFCVSAPLHAATGGHVCVDATGVMRTTTTPCPDEPVDGDPLRCPSS
jgi:prepilin-type N-terminal cleavage/methylation domain-containing protein